MEIIDAASKMGRSVNVGERARSAQLYPPGTGSDGLLAVDLLEIEPGGSTALLRHAEEHVLFVVHGSCEIQGEGGPVGLLRSGSAVHVGPREAHALRNSGPDRLLVLVSTPLIVRSERALGYVSDPASLPAAPPAAVNASTSAPARERTERVAERGPAAPEPDPEVERPQQERARSASQPVPAPDPEAEAPLPDISSLMKRGSDIAATPRNERKRPVREPEPEPEPEPAPVEPAVEEEDEAEEAHSTLMELAVVFDGGSRGTPGQGYGSYLVQSPGRKPVIKRVEFGENYTPAQAEYQSLIACLQYIIERLTVTNRTPSQVALDIKSNSDSLVNQLQGNYKVKEANVRSRHTQAMELLEEFGEWMITWHAQEESVRLLGH